MYGVNRQSTMKYIVFMMRMYTEGEKLRSLVRGCAHAIMTSPGERCQSLPVMDVFSGVCVSKRIMVGARGSNEKSEWGGDNRPMGGGAS